MIFFISFQDIKYSNDLSFLLRLCFCSNTILKWIVPFKKRIFTPDGPIDHVKTRTFGIQTGFNHSNTWHVQYSDPHWSQREIEDTKGHGLQTTIIKEGQDEHWGEWMNEWMKVYILLSKSYDCIWHDDMMKDYFRCFSNF